VLPLQGFLPYDHLPDDFCVNAAPAVPPLSPFRRPAPLARLGDGLISPARAELGALAPLPFRAVERGIRQQIVILGRPDRPFALRIPWRHNQSYLGWWTTPANGAA